MKVAIASQGRELSSEMGSLFGRCPVFLFVDTDTGTVEARDNAARDAFGGAGVEAARFVVSHGAEVVIAPKVGPKAQDVLDGAGLRVHLHVGGKAADALASLQAKDAV